MKELEDVKKAYQLLIDDYIEKIHRLAIANAQMDGILYEVYWEYKKTGHLTPELMDKIKKRLEIET